MAPAKVNVDYYAVLEISNTATLENVTKSYRRLVKLRHPDRNITEEDSTEVFQLVSPMLFLRLPTACFERSQPLTICMKLQNAYETISDPEKRRAYDAQWKSIRDSLRAKQVPDRRRARTAAAEYWRKTEEAEEIKDRQNAQKKHVQELEYVQSVFSDDLLEVNKKIEKITADLKHLEDCDDKDLEQQKEPTGWLLYLASRFYRKIEETEEQKEAPELEKLQRVAVITIKKSELLGQEAKLQRLQDALEKVQMEIEGEKKNAEDKARAEAQAKAREQEAEAKRAAAEATRKARRTFSPTSAASGSSSRTAFDASGSSTENNTCQHQRFWPKVEGRQFCRKCCTFQRLFAFECPDCGIVTCASCRQSLRGE